MVTGFLLELAAPHAQRARRFSDATIPNVNGGVRASGRVQHLRTRAPMMRASHSPSRPFFIAPDVLSSVVSRSMRLRVSSRFSRECQKDFAREITVENTAQKVCNLSHGDSSCTVARSANRVILDPHFSPLVLPSRGCATPRYNASSLQFLRVIPRVISSSLP